MNIKKFLVGATIVMTAMSTMAELSARPMGGGKSIGRQSQNVNSMPKQATPAPAPAAPTAAPAAGRPGAAPAAAPVQKPSMWKGLLGGALLGLGLGALLSSLGIGGAFASAIGTILTIALIGGVIFFIIAMIRRKSQPAGMQPAAAFSGAGAGYNPQPQQPQQPMAFQPVQPAAAPAVAPVASAAAAHTPWGVPADFDTAGFLRAAKSNYIRLQAAWDKADVEDIRTFTTPEVFAELRMQIQERGAQAEYTDVVTIDAELLGIENDGREYMASVKFWGTMKPAADALPESFQEVWNLSKPVSGNTGWMLAGIQQVA
ncbi:TIM44-like domain-containing protein [Pseudoduganella sp. DS3]|uniref:TIM44-like domain-containing protein n=1 Tax=Pseudoduganella guangdongensis TaxID=2692179 RepID=A0A6N9HGP4_9BURK|nr:Tim44-like domain-containing protein [Pseudoduganella guangdongensis]MYN02758.1 TIM44-like domain-containing protein [Pseudoduganella guangdongensis]